MVAQMPRPACRTLGYNEAETIESFPDAVALALGLDCDSVVQRDPVAWTLPAQAAVFA